MVKAVIKRFRDVSMLEWMYYIRPEYPPINNVLWKDLEDNPLTNVLRNMPVRRALPLRSSVTAVLGRPEQ